MEFFYGFALLVASYIITLIVSSPKHQPPKPASMDDMNIPQAEEGTPQIVVFGDCWMEDWTVLAYGNFRTSKIKTSGKSKK